MKKVKSSNRSTGAKSNGAPKNIDEYLAGVPEPARSALVKIRAAIRSVVPTEASETISYGMPAFKYKGVLVWFAAFSNHCSLFPTASVVEAFQNELKGYSTSKPNEADESCARIFQAESTQRIPSYLKQCRSVDAEKYGSVAS